MEGTPFGRYSLVELIGRGGMGEVWRAYDSDTDRIVAIKVLPAHYSDNEDFTQRFRREAHAAARLNTPHVIPIHHFGEIDGRLYVDMRLIEGSDLQTVLTGGPIEPARAVRIVEQIAMALQAAHEVGLLHRDVKPSNILLDRHDFAYLIDFGIARAADETRLTKSGNTIGTFHYIAPERLGADAEDARADIYSLTCVLYECLTGSPPFDEPTMARLVAAHLSTPPPKPSIAEPKVPARIDRVITTGMAKDPEDRYSTAVELAQAVREAVAAPTGTPDATLYAFASSASAAEPTMVVDPTPIDPEPAWPRRARSRTTLIATISAATAIVLAAFGITAYLLRPQPAASAAQTTSAAAPTEPPAPPPPPPPVTESSLDGLLLSPDQVNTAMGVTGMTLHFAPDVMDSGEYIAAMETACHGVNGPAIALTYAGSGWTAFREQALDMAGNAPWLDQAVVLFPSAQAADAFLAASAQKWLACHEFNVPHGNGTRTWTVGPVVNANGVLSVTNRTDIGTWTFCQRALTVANNVAIDISACTLDQSQFRADSAVNVARQIAAKVPTS